MVKIGYASTNTDLTAVHRKDSPFLLTVYKLLHSAFAVPFIIYLQAKRIKKNEKEFF